MLGLLPISETEFRPNEKDRIGEHAPYLFGIDPNSPDESTGRMCGRYTLANTGPLRALLGAGSTLPAPRYNIAPTQQVSRIFDESPTPFPKRVGS